MSGDRMGIASFPYWEKISQSLLHIFPQNKFQVNKNVNVYIKTLKLLEENIEKCLYNPRLGKDGLDKI